VGVRVICVCMYVCMYVCILCVCVCGLWVMHLARTILDVVHTYSCGCVSCVFSTLQERYGSVLSGRLGASTHWSI
jgi:hypothetical protein